MTGLDIMETSLRPLVEHITAVTTELLRPQAYEDVGEKTITFGKIHRFRDVYPANSVRNCLRAINSTAIESRDVGLSKKSNERF